MFRLHSCNDRHSPIDLPHAVPIKLGRSPTTKITDKACSREQISVTADNEKGVVLLTQLGRNPSTFNGKEIQKGESKTLKHGDKFCMVSDLHLYQVINSGEVTKSEKPPGRKRTIESYFSSKVSEDCGTGTKKPKISENTEKNQEDEVQAKLDFLLKNSSTKQPSTKGESSKSQQPQTASSCDEEKYVKSVYEPGWIEYEDMLIYNSPNQFNSRKIASFDMDGTLITTASGRAFAQDHNDWKILYSEIPGKLKALQREEFKLVIITNQLGIGKGKLLPKDFKTKVENILKKFGVPIQVIAITKRGPNRKPNIGAWNWLKSSGNGDIPIDMVKSFYVGDAAGRPKDWAPKRKKDFSCSDRLFAINLNIPFKTPEEFFLSQKAAKFNMPEFNPKSIADNTILSENANTNIVSEQQEVIVMVGYPASGKSYFSKEYLVSQGYVCVNRDTMKTWQKCVTACQQALANGKSVVIDNTNTDKVSRKRYIDCAKSRGCDCRCFSMQVSMDHARHNNRFRELSGSDHDKVPDMVFYQYRKAFEEPVLDEGFSSIVKINFVPKFKDENMKMKYYLYTD